MTSSQISLLLAVLCRWFFYVTRWPLVGFRTTVKSLGPCHVLANFNELLRTILSLEYIKMYVLSCQNLLLLSVNGLIVFLKQLCYMDRLSDRIFNRGTRNLFIGNQKRHLYSSTSQQILSKASIQAVLFFLQRCQLFKKHVGVNLGPFF